MREACIILLCLAALLLPACNRNKPTIPDDSVLRGPVPAYSDIATRYNQRVEPLNRLFARANLFVQYFDQEGERQTESPEGRLQVIRPDRLALSLGKAGQTLFWFGCDPEKYWWFDLSDSSRRLVAVGRHGRFEQSASRRIGLAVEPLDLIRVLGITPLDPGLPGATQWSKDGALLGVTTPIGRRGFQRLWLDPTSLIVRTVEIFDARKELVLIAEHEGSEPVEQSQGSSGAAPRIAGRITASHLDSGTDIRLTLTGARDGPISDKAFDLPTLMDRNGVDEVIDLDRPPRSRTPASATGG